MQEIFHPAEAQAQENSRIYKLKTLKMIPQHHVPTKMDNEWHWTVNGDSETYILATSPPVGWFTLIQLKKKEEGHYMIDGMDLLRDDFNKIEPGLYEWVKRAVTIHQHAEDLRKEFGYNKAIELGGRTYKVQLNPRSGEVSVGIEGHTIVSNRSTLTDHEPELMYISSGRVMSKIIDYLAPFWKDMEDRPEEKLSTPFVFYNVHSFKVDGDQYEIAYVPEADMLYLKMPDRTIKTHVDILDTCAELNEIHRGHLAPLVRKFVDSVWAVG